VVSRIVFDVGLEEKSGIQDFLFIGGSEKLGHVFQASQPYLTIDR
jgi:hypothetical protein